MLLRGRRRRSRLCRRSRYCIDRPSPVRGRSLRHSHPRLCRAPRTAYSAPTSLSWWGRCRAFGVRSPGPGRAPRPPPGAAHTAPPHAHCSRRPRGTADTGPPPAHAAGRWCPRRPTSAATPPAPDPGRSRCAPVAEPRHSHGLAARPCSQPHRARVDAVLAVDPARLHGEPDQPVPPRAVHVIHRYLHPAAAPPIGSGARCRRTPGSSASFSRSNR